MELSFLGTKVPWYESSSYRVGYKHHLAAVGSRLRSFYDPRLQDQEYGNRTLRTYRHVGPKKVKKVKVHIALYGLETHHRATERHLPYGITQCYLPPDTGEQVTVA